MGNGRQHHSDLSAVKMYAEKVVRRTHTHCAIKRNHQAHGVLSIETGYKEQYLHSWEAIRPNKEMVGN